MNTSQYRHLITFQERSVSQDQYGGLIEQWTDLFTDIWSRFEPGKNIQTNIQSFDAVERRVVERQARFHVRNEPRILDTIQQESHRIVFTFNSDVPKLSIWKIQPPVPTENQVELIIEATQVDIPL